VVCFALMCTVMQLGHRIAPAGSISHQQKYWVYVGTAHYTGDPAENLYVYRFDSETGRLSLHGIAAKTVNPGFLTVHPGGSYLYAVNEIGDFQGQKNGAVSSFRIDGRTGELRFLNQRPAFGANPSYVTVSRKGRFAIVASYYGGIVSFPILDNGSLGKPASAVQETGVGVKAARPDGSHPHSVVFSPDGRFVIAPDLGLDRLLVYRFDEATGSLTRNDPAFSEALSGSGPRHIVFASSGRFAYVVQELQSSVSTYSYDAKLGVLHHLQTISTLPENFHGSNTGAEIQVAASGRFVYASNRGHDSIVVFAVDPQAGTLTALQHIPTQGKTPRNFVLDPSGNFLLVGNQDSNQIAVFRVDQQSGQLSPLNEKLEVFSPTCIAFADIF
jgi:6-phosphogluconolactonase